MSNKPGHRGEHEVSRKTIARGMPGVSGVTVVTMLVCLFFLHTRLRAHWPPGIPCALCNRRTGNSGKTRAQSRGEIARPYLYAAGCLQCEVGKLAPPSLRAKRSPDGAKRNPGPYSPHRDPGLHCAPSGLQQRLRCVERLVRRSSKSDRVRRSPESDRVRRSSESEGGRRKAEAIKSDRRYRGPGTRWRSMSRFAP